MISESNVKELLRLKISGKSDEQWSRLSNIIFNLIESIAQNANVGDTSAIESSGIQVSKDVADIALNWAKAKIENPSLENENIRAEIVEKYENSKKIVEEKMKTIEETKKISSERKKIEAETISINIDNLERIIKLFYQANDISAFMQNKDQHLFINNEREKPSIE